MVGRQGRKLAYELISNQFGELVGKVCKCLLSKGPLSLSELARFSQLLLLDLRNCILVLVQHNCVQAFKMEIQGTGLAPSKILTSYIAIVNNILHRMRFPKFLMVVREDLGEEAEALIEGLLEHGRLSLEQMIQRAVARSNKGVSDLEQPLKETFASLVRSHYVEHCPAPEPLLAPKPPPEAKRARGSLRVRSVLSIEGEENRVMAAAAPMETERFLLVSRTVNGARTDESISDEKAGYKRKRDALEMDTKTMMAVDEKEVLWRVNFEEVVRRLRHKECIKQARARIDAGAGTILQAMLDMTRSSEISAKQYTSAPLSMDAITQAVRAVPEGRTMTMERIRMALQMMSSESVGFITKAGELGNQYVINLFKLIESARRSEVEGIVLQRFGKDSCRIFRLLAMKGQLEQKQASDIALVPSNVASDILYRLFKEEYVQLQEVSKAADHAPSRTIYLWHINYPSLIEHILEDMFRAASNVGQRLTYELQQEQEILDVLKQYHHSKASKDAPTVTLTQDQHARVKRIRKIATVLETSLLKLDDSILLFCDF